MASTHHLFNRVPLCQEENLDALLELAAHIGNEQLFGL
jgi:hypothetical protein